MHRLSLSVMTGLSAGNSAPRNPAARKGMVVVARVAAVVRAEAVPVAMAAKVAVVQVVKEARAEADVRVESVVLRQGKRRASQRRCRSKTPRLRVRGVCGSG